jgi:hypothetical protein
MNKRKMIDPDRLTKLLRDPIVIRIVTVLDIVSLSILELLEYGISRKDVSYALANDIVMFDKSVLIYNDISSSFPLTEGDIISGGDYYFHNFLNSKVKLTDLGLYILETLKAEQLKANVPSNNVNRFEFHSSLENIRP